MNAIAKDGQFNPDTSVLGLALPMVSAARFAELSGIPVGVVRGWIAKGYLPTYSMGKYTMINLALLNHMAMQKAFSL